MLILTDFKLAMLPATIPAHVRAGNPYDGRGGKKGTSPGNWVQARRS